MYPPDDAEIRRQCYIDCFVAVSLQVEYGAEQLEKILNEVGLKQQDLQKSGCTLI